jgi:hypothetical protein
MPPLEQGDADRKQRDALRQLGEERALHRRATIRRITDIAWSAVIASEVTIVVVTSLGCLTTQAVVEKAREQGAEELVALRAGICTAWKSAMLQFEYSRQWLTATQQATFFAAQR